MADDADDEGKSRSNLSWTKFKAIISTLIVLIGGFVTLQAFPGALVGFWRFFSPLPQDGRLLLEDVLDLSLGPEKQSAALNAYLKPVQQVNAIDLSCRHFRNVGKYQCDEIVFEGIRIEDAEQVLSVSADELRFHNLQLDRSVEIFATVVNVDGIFAYDRFLYTELRGYSYVEGGELIFAKVDSGDQALEIVGTNISATRFSSDCIVNYLDCPIDLIDDRRQSAGSGIARFNWFWADLPPRIGRDEQPLDMAVHGIHTRICDPQPSDRHEDYLYVMDGIGNLVWASEERYEELHAKSLSHGYSLSGCHVMSVESARRKYPEAWAESDACEPLLESGWEQRAVPSIRNCRNDETSALSPRG